MKCNNTLIIILISISSVLTASVGLGTFADNINPLIFYLADIIRVLLTFLSIAFFVYTFSLWRLHRKNPVLTPITSIITSFLVALSCGFFAISSYYSEERYTIKSHPPLQKSVVFKKTFKGKKEVNTYKLTK